MDIPSLQEKLEIRALNKLNNDIRALSEYLKYEIKWKELISGVSIEIKKGEGSMHPWLSQLFDAEPVKKAIIEKRLPEYVEAEIKALMNPKKTN